MIIKIETEITGSFSIEKDMKVKQYPYKIDIRFDEDSSKFLISISKREINYSSYLPKIEIKDQVVNTIRYPSQEFLQEQLKILQHIESFGSIDKNIERINWQNCSIEWIPETVEERKLLPIKNYQKKMYYEFNHKVLTQDWLQSTIIHRRQLENLVLPLAFFREGANFFHKFQYQNSFINFYLMLEGFFSNGKHWKNEVIIADFINSEIMNYSIDSAIKYLEQTGGKHYEWLINMCKKYNKKPNIEGVAHILVEQRGSLSHFSLASSRKQKDAFADKEYESLAYLAMMICIKASVKLRLEPFKKK